MADKRGTGDVTIGDDGEYPFDMAVSENADVHERRRKKLVIRSRQRLRNPFVWMLIIPIVALAVLWVGMWSFLPVLIDWGENSGLDKIQEALAVCDGDWIVDEQSYHSDPLWYGENPTNCEPTRGGFLEGSWECECDVIPTQDSLISEGSMP